jgi:hypothetical protein
VINDSDVQLKYGSLKILTEFFRRSSLKKQVVFGGFMEKPSGKFCGADCVMLMELAHGSEINRVEIPSCTANWFILHCITPVCLLYFGPNDVVLEQSVRLRVLTLRFCGSDKE